MEQDQVNALINAFVNQRNTAMNALAEAQVRIQMLEKELADLKDGKKPDGPLANKVM
jgi:hypothetical protein